MKQKAIPQFEFPVIGQEFNLSGETATDGERLTRERRAEVERQAQARQLQQKQQTPLI
jgi:hypothetical protein